MVKDTLSHPSPACLKFASPSTPLSHISPKKLLNPPASLHPWGHFPSPGHGHPTLGQQQPQVFVGIQLGHYLIQMHMVTEEFSRSQGAYKGFTVLKVTS